MKKLQNEIANLEESIEMGLLTQEQAQNDLIDLRCEILEQFEEYSKEADLLIRELLEVNSLFLDLYNL